MFAWRVVISEQDGMGGGTDKSYWFVDYDDAHAYYKYIKSLANTPFHPHVVEPPNLVEVPMPKIYGKGEWKRYT